MTKDTYSPNELDRILQEAEILNQLYENALAKLWNRIKDLEDYPAAICIAQHSEAIRQSFGEIHQTGYLIYEIRQSVNWDIAHNVLYEPPKEVEAENQQKTSEPNYDGIPF